MTTKREKVTLDLTVPAKISGPPKDGVWLRPDVAIVRVEDARAAKAVLDGLKAEERDRVEWFAQLKAPLRDLSAQILAKEKAALEPVRVAIRTLSQKLLDWRALDERLRREEEARRRQEAEAAAEATRQQQLAALEEAAKSTASRIEKKALRSTAEALATAPVVPQPPPPVAPAPKITGLYERESWTGEVVDFQMLVVGAATPLLEQLLGDPRFPLNEVEAIGARKFVAWLRSGFGVAPLDALVPNASRLNSLAASNREDLPIPGVRAVRKTSLVSRG